jgi:6,7-dimethyl-8-ribityllumazine synthase
MASALKNLSDYDASNVPAGTGKSFGIVVSEWNIDITRPLLDGCLDTLKKYDVSEKNIVVNFVPGTFELPLGAQLLAQRNHLAGIVCIGCVIKGETQHDEYISHAAAQGIMRLGQSLGMPVVFCVLTTGTHAQAMDRAGGAHGNKGVEAAVTVLKMAAF